MPERLTPLNVATPLPCVAALPTLFPFSVKATVFPPTGLPPPVSVAERVVVPPYVPFAAATARVVAVVVAATSSKQTLTLETAGVTEPLVVERNALYLRKRR